MEPFSPEEQERYRAAFIDEARRKAWQARCHVAWTGKKFDRLTASAIEVRETADAYEAEHKRRESALDSHTVENRDKRKELRAAIDALTVRMQKEYQQANALAESMATFLGNADANLDVAEFAKTWVMPEATEPEEDPVPPANG